MFEPVETLPHFNLLHHAHERCTCRHICAEDHKLRFSHGAAIYRFSALDLQLGTTLQGLDGNKPMLNNAV